MNNMTIELSQISLITLLLIANGAPIIARYIFGDKYAKPIDANRRFFDGKVILGHSKTLRGVAASVSATGLAAPLLGIPIHWGIIVGAFTMLGDLITSFIKRRLSIEPSGMALGLDHIPEAMLPLFIVSNQFDLSFTEILTMSTLFWLLAIGLSKVLFVWNIRRRPY